MITWTGTAAEDSLLGPFALRLPRSGHIRHEKTVPKCRREAIPLQRIFCCCPLCTTESSYPNTPVLNKQSRQIFLLIRLFLLNKILIANIYETLFIYFYLIV